jgi:hypothetical protein
VILGVIEELPREAVQAPDTPLPRREVEAEAKGMVRVSLEGPLDLVEEPADLAAQKRLEQLTPHLLRRGPLDGAGICRYREVPRRACTGLSRQGAEVPEFGGKLQWLVGPLFLEAGVNLESIMPVGRKAEVEVFVDQEHPSKGPPWELGERRRSSWVYGYRTRNGRVLLGPLSTGKSTVSAGTLVPWPGREPSAMEKTVALSLRWPIG